MPKAGPVPDPIVSDSSIYYDERPPIDLVYALAEGQKAKARDMTRTISILLELARHSVDCLRSVFSCRIDRVIADACHCEQADHCVTRSYD